jgi:NADPH-dependent curcumin reductase CurA
MAEINRQIVLASRPAATAGPENFRLVETPLAPLQDGEVRIRNCWLSVDPYMRGRMNDAKSYAAPHPLGAPMIGGTAGEVVESRHPKWKAGDRVVANFGWQDYGTSNGRGLQRVSDEFPLQAWLGALGMPGVTAWYGLNRICAPKAGETVLVSAAAGAVGSVAGQMAKARGCRVIGIAGGPDKCRHVEQALGFDACIDYKAGPVGAALKAAAPAGIDAYFDNVAGDILDAALLRMNPHGRVALCGMIGGMAGYEGAAPPLKNYPMVLMARLRLEGFIVSDHLDLWPQAVAELEGLARGKQLVWHETVAEGLENAPAALFSLLRGGNLGKQLVKL